jgi:hypothetical protein
MSSMVVRVARVGLELFDMCFSCGIRRPCEASPAPSGLFTHPRAAVSARRCWVRHPVAGNWPATGDIAMAFDEWRKREGVFSCV